jgi:hypothetical protein
MSFHQGGWGMYPTAIVGLIVVAAAVMFARNPDARRAQLVRHLSMLTFLVGSLGTVTGVIKSLTSLEDTTPINYALIGVGESLNCVGLALVCMVLAGTIAAIGRTRSAKADLADPHAL